MKKLLIIVIMLFVLLPISAKAAEDTLQSEYDMLKIGELKDSLRGDASRILGDIDILESSNYTEGFNKIFSDVASKFGAIVRKGISSAATIIVIAILTSLAETLYESLSSGVTPSYIPMIGTVAIAAVAVADVGSFLKLGSETIRELSIFSKVLLPTLTAAAAASGAITSAAAKYAVTALFIDILITVGERVIVPLIFAYTAAVIANAAIGGEGLQGAVNALKWIAVTTLSALILIFIAYLSISGVISGTADALTSRVAKTTLSTVLPVVGSIISDAASSIIAGAGMLRNAVGVFGLLSIAAICATPFLRLGVQYLCYKFAAGITAAVSGGRIAKLISGIGTAFGIMMGLTGSMAVLLYFSIISLLKAVGV
jgi:stage III sporulation protein AE